MTHIARASAMAAAALVLLPSTVQAQVEERMRDCRGMADAGARIACYDSIPLDALASGAAGEPAGSASPAPRAPAAFGANQLPAPPSATSHEPDRMSARVALAVERQPGLWLITLEDGSDWLFVDGAPSGYDPPRAGATVDISRASLGSYLLRYRGQRAVRARRVR